MELTISSAIIVGTTIGNIIYAYDAYQKKIHFEKILKLIDDFDEIKTIEWYIKFLVMRIQILLLGIVITYLLVEMFVNNMENVGISVGYYALTTTISLAFWLVLKIRKSKQTNIDTSIKNDSRPPILFLRPFALDGESANVLLDKSNVITIEDIALSFTELLGPSVAIASPFRNENEIFGASKQHFIDWESSVLDLMEKSSLIILRPSDSDGIMWEFRNIVKKGYLRKLIIYVNFGKKNVLINKLTYLDFKSNLYLEFGIRLADYDIKQPRLYFDINNNCFCADDCFDIPIFRKVFYSQFIIAKKGGRIKV